MPNTLGGTGGSALGAWGYGVESDDLVLDVIGEFKDFLKQNPSVSAATQHVLSRFADSASDPDEGPLLWLAISKAQWTYGTVDEDVLSRVRTDFETGAGLERWEDSASDLKKRRERLRAFIEKVSQPNLKPSRFPKLVVRAPVFQPGDCLSVQLDGGLYSAAIVLAADHRLAEYGQNLIGVLDFLSDSPPDDSVYEARKWLRLTHHNWDGKLDVCWYGAYGFRSFKKRINVVGQTVLLGEDPTDSPSHSSWRNLGPQVALQHAWSSSTQQAHQPDSRKVD